MIRIIVQTTDFGEAAHIGGPVYTSHKTFDVEAPEAEAFLRQFSDAKKPVWFSRQAIGVEVITAPAKTEGESTEPRGE